MTSALTGRMAPLYRDARLAPAVLAARLRHGRPRLVLTFRGGIGDDLLCTAVFRELRRRDFDRVWMLSEWPDLFAHNDDVETALPWEKNRDHWIERFGWPLLNPRYTKYVRSERRYTMPAGHLITMMCQQTGIVGPITRRPYLTLRDDERAAGALVPRQVAIQSSGLAKKRYRDETKEWFADRFQEVVSHLRPEFDFVQVGGATDPPLHGALDLRGRTSRRETAAILSRSLAFVGNAGFLKHAARAVECRSVIVYGGRERPDQTGYSCNENLYAAVPCAPCWRVNSCDLDRLCMRQITAGDVVDGVRRAAAKHGTPLEVDTDTILADVPDAPSTRRGRPMLTITDPRGVSRRVEAKILAGM